ncbi:MAG: hypothetical protein ACRDL3_08890 [Solirubrobacterales bacterium]
MGSHLPDGREPGPQSRRMEEGRRVSGAVLPAMTVLFIACFIGIPLAVVAATDSEGVIYATLGVLAVAFVVGMWLVARRFRPAAAPEPDQFEVFAQPPEVWRGEKVEADLAILDPDGLGEGIEVGVVCVERYDRPVTSRTEQGTVTERKTGEAVAYERWLPAWRIAEPQTFRFTIPLDAPYSHEGDCLSFAWRVSAREQGARGAAETSDDPIWVLP